MIGTLDPVSEPPLEKNLEKKPPESSDFVVAAALVALVDTWLLEDEGNLVALVPLLTSIKLLVVEPALVAKNDEDDSFVGSTEPYKLGADDAN